MPDQLENIGHLLQQPAHPDYTARKWAGEGKGLGVSLPPTFVLSDVESSLPILEEKLKARIEGGYPVDAGVAPHYVSWLVLLQTQLTDPRLDDIAVLIGADPNRSEKYLTGDTPHETQHRVFPLGRTAMHATEFIGYSRTLFGTLISFQPLGRVVAGLQPES